MGIGQRSEIRWLSVIVLGLAMPGTAEAEGVKMLRAVGFAAEAFVRPEVREECELQTKLPHFVQQYAQEQGIEVQLVDTLPQNGRVLQVELVDTFEQGNAWIGRSKGLTIRGQLLEGGKPIGSFRGRRSTSGGAFGGYKGNCAFFGRCAKTLGADVAKWLRSPSPNASLGE
jgi:hypothetical protein